MRHIRNQQKFIRETRAYELGSKEDILEAFLGIVSESGEVLDLYKKSLYKKKDINKKKLKLELGDVLYYILYLADVFDIKVYEILKANKEKLEDRRRRKIYNETLADAHLGSDDEIEEINDLIKALREIKR